MPIEIREARAEDLDALRDLTALAFESIFESFEKILGQQIFPVVYPDWRKLQRGLIDTFFEHEKSVLCVAVVDGTPAGLMAYQLRHDENQGEIEFLAVHPEHQNAGIGTLLSEFALTKMREAGLKVAVVGTGGDESHAPARKAYEKAGFRPLPNVWYFKYLD